MGQEQPQAPGSCGQLHRKATLLSTGPAVTTQGTTSQPARARASPAFQHPHGHQPHHNRRMYTAHIGNIPRVSGGQGGSDHLGQRAGPHCSRTPSIKMTFERHVYSGLKIKTKMCSSGPTIFHPIQEGSRQMGAATSPRLARWARKPCHLTRPSSGRGGQTGQDALARQCHVFFWKQEEHLEKRVLSSQWNDVRRDLLSRAAVGASLHQAGPRPARCASSHAARDLLGFVRPHRRQPTRLPCPWDSPGNNTGVGCHFLLQ